MSSGLSIVHSITTMIGGSISVDSQVGKGTTIKVSLPLKRPLFGQQPTNGPLNSGGTGGSAMSQVDDPAAALQQIASNKTVALYGLNTQPGQKALADVLSKYLEGWYNFRIVGERDADIVLVDEDALEAFLEHVIVDLPTQSAVIVLCSVGTRYSSTYVSQLQKRLHCVVELIAKPFGPNKLAKSFFSVLEKSSAIKVPPSLTTLKTSTTDEQLAPISIQPETSPNDISHRLHEMDLNGSGGIGSPGGMGSPDQVVQATETFAISQNKSACTESNP